MSKEIWANLRKKVSVEEFFQKKKFYERNSEEKIYEISKEINNEEKEKLKKISDNNKGTGKAILLDKDFNEIKKISARSLNVSLKKAENIYAIIIDGIVTQTLIKSAEQANVKLIAANNFSVTSSKIKLLSL